MLPKTIRIIIWVSLNGTLSPCATYELATKGQILRERGYRPLMQFKAPLRRLKTGWFLLYQEAAASLCRRYAVRTP